MSTTDGAASNSASTNGVAKVELDVAKLHSLPTEQQDLFLLTFVSDLRRHVASLPREALSSQQAPIKREVFKVVGLGTPSPSRIIRQTLSKVLADVFEQSSSTSLAETINELVGLLNAGKGEKDVGTKHAATACLGQLFNKVGSRASSLAPLVTSSLLKLQKNTQAHTGARGAIFKALGLVVAGLAGSLDEQLARDIWKQARNAATAEKSGFVQLYACRCLEALVVGTSYFNNSNDFETLKTVVWRVVDSEIPTVRHAAAYLLASALFKAYSERAPTDSVPVIKQPKKSKKQGPDDEDDTLHDRSLSPIPVKSSVRLVLNLSEALQVLSAQYCKSSTSNRARAALTIAYKAFFLHLPERTREQQYSVIAEYLFNDLVNHPTIYFHRYRYILTRNFVRILMDKVLAANLTENGQITAARWIVNEILKNYPQVLQERKEPSKRVLVMALTILWDLLTRLGAAASTIQDSCREALLQVMQHPSYSVQTHAAQCCKQFVSGCPTQLVRSIEGALAQLKRNLEVSSETRHAHRKSVGCAFSIASMLRSARRHTLYGSVELFSRIFTEATELLKLSSTSELRLSAVQIRVAWTLLGGSTTIGPSFVKVHLNSLLLLWRNACPPPLAADNTGRRGQLELSFLTHVRECALTALLAFLKSCSTLVTADGAKRILSVLQNSVQFLETLPTVRQTDEATLRLIPALQIEDHILMLRRRILQCYEELLGLRHLDHTDIVSQVDLVGMSMRTFSNPERPTQRNLEASLANSASNFDTVWTADDNWGYGVNSLVCGFETALPNTPRPIRVGPTTKSVDSVEDRVNEIIVSPIATALEHDSTLVYTNADIGDSVDLANSPTGVINASIKLFAAALPLLPKRVQEGAIEQLATVLAQPLPRDPGKKAAIRLNAATALLCALAVGNAETSFARGKLDATVIGAIAAEILFKCIVDTDEILRAIGAEALGRLCNLAGSQITNNQIKLLIDTIVANRDSHTRAGCALSLGCIHAQVGAMAAGVHLKSIVGVLLSLCNDPHPTVHFWALKGLSEVADSAGLSFSPYVASTLGMLAQLYSSDAHNAEAPPLLTSNTELEYPTTFEVGKCVNCIINVLGPDLQDVAKARSLILTLVGYFQAEEALTLRIQSLSCLGHIWLYAPAHVQLCKYTQDLQKGLSSEDSALASVCISGLANLMKRNANEVARVAPPSLADDIWAAIDSEPQRTEPQDMLRHWMQQSCLTDTAQWVEQCQKILSKTRQKNQSKAQLVPATAKTAEPDLADEDVAGLTADVAEKPGNVPDSAMEGQEFLRWQTRELAMRLLSEMIDIIRDASLPDQVIHAESVMQSKVAEIVRIAFSASTANVVELRILGLRILDQVLKMFGKTPDPDFLEASLLEQYQAQISSALTPAFASDSSPELAAEAIAVCATFVATGIATNVDRMGRIFKVLSIGLDNISEPAAELALGDLKGLSANALDMLRLSLLSAWAQLQLASVEQSYLEDILHPFLPRLAPLWLASLQEFAGLRFQPEISDTLGGELLTSNLDERYAAFNREVRLQYYEARWLNLVEAIAFLVDKDSEAVFDALDRKQDHHAVNGVNGTTVGGKDMSFREEPVAFFFILFGLAFEALVTQARDSAAQALAILRALQKILTPAVSGNAIYEDVVFNETTDTLDRIAMTSNASTQSVLVEIARKLSLNHVSAKSTHEREEKLSDDIDQLFELTRILILVMTGLVPTLEDPPGHAVRGLVEDGVDLIEASFRALVDVADVFPSIIRADLHACILHCYCTILATGICQDDVLPRVMPMFRAFLQENLRDAAEEINTRLVHGALSRMLSILTYAQRRESDSSIGCAKNTLLSITILLTTVSTTLRPQDGLVIKAVDEILDCLQDIGLAKIAASCVRSLLLTSPKTICDESICRILWPQIISFITDTETTDPEGVRTPLIQALVTSVSTIKGTGREAAMAVLLPLLLARAHHVSPNGSTEDLRKDSALRLLELAGMDGHAFRKSVSNLRDGQKADLQSLLRIAGVGGRMKEDQTTGEEAKPTIALRMDF